MSIGLLENLVQDIFAIGGVTMMALLAVAALVAAIALFKAMQFKAMGFGRHRGIDAGVRAWDNGHADRATASLAKSRNQVVPLLIDAANAAPGQRNRLIAKVDAYYARLTRGFGVLDIIMRTAPLLGVLGTIMALIAVLQASAGTPGIPEALWMTLPSTALGLAIAVPTAIIIRWLENRVASEKRRVLLALEALCSPAGEATRASARQAETAPMELVKVG